MSEYKDIKGCVYPVYQSSLITDDEREKMQQKIVEELCAVFKH